MKKYSIGVDLGGTKTLLVIVNAEGQPVYEQQWRSINDPPAIIQMVQNALRNAAFSEPEIMTMGIGVAGITDPGRGIVVEAPALRWSNFHLSDEIKPFFNFPIFIGNDVKCAALGEQWLGAAKGIGDFIFIALGTGVGSAIMVNGNIVHGKDFMAGEIGYLVEKGDVDKGKDQGNTFGKFGLFEQKVSGKALEKRFNSSEEFFQNYRKGDRRAREVMGEFIRDLSVAIANVVSLLNPEKVILGGGVSKSLTPVIDLIRAAVTRLTPIRTHIEITGLADQAGALGAAAYALRRLKQ